MHYIKVVETGVEVGKGGDAEQVARFLGHPSFFSCETLWRFKYPIAPVQAALKEGKRLKWSTLLKRTGEAVDSCKADWVLIEGAGGLAVPLEEEPCYLDWADFARCLPVEGLLIVIDDRLGAINQARLTVDYALRRGLKGGLWLNGSQESEGCVAAANFEVLRDLALPLWAKQSYNDPAFQSFQAPWMRTSKNVYGTP